MAKLELVCEMHTHLKHTYWRCVHIHLLHTLTDMQVEMLFTQKTHSAPQFFFCYFTQMLSNGPTERT